MNFLLPIYIWPIFRLLMKNPGKNVFAAMQDAEEDEVAEETKTRTFSPVAAQFVVGLDRLMSQEAKNRPNIDWQEKIHRGILRSLRNISETP